MFNHPHHQTILKILQYLNKDLLQECNTYFAGGTRIALDFDEYRLSRDIDFICMTGEPYRKIREAVYNKKYDALFLPNAPFTFPRDIQTNQYGIRFPIMINEQSIKFEIIVEARISFDKAVQPKWSPVWCINHDDSFVEKLLANADRGRDKATCARDLIDLAMIRLNVDITESHYQKAEQAYPIKTELAYTIEHFQQNPDYREHCYNVMQITHCQELIDGLDMLANDLGISITKRIENETKPNNGT